MNYYDTSEIACLLKIKVPAVNYRIRKLKLKPKYIANISQFPLYNDDDLNSLKTFKRSVYIKETFTVINVVETYFIAESMMNFYTLKKLEKFNFK